MHEKSASPGEIANLSIRQTQPVTHATPPRLVDSHAFRDQHRWKFLPKERNSDTWASCGSILQHIWGRKSKTKRETSVSKTTIIMGLLTCPFYPLGFVWAPMVGRLNLPKITSFPLWIYPQISPAWLQWTWKKHDATTMMNHTQPNHHVIWTFMTVFSIFVLL